MRNIFLVIALLGVLGTQAQQISLINISGDTTLQTVIAAGGPHNAGKSWTVGETPQALRAMSNCPSIYNLPNGTVIAITYSSIATTKINIR